MSKPHLRVELESGLKKICLGKKNKEWNFYKYKLLLMDDTERTRLEGHRLRYRVKRIRKLLLSKQGKTLAKTSTICLPNPYATAPSIVY